MTRLEDLSRRLEQELAVALERSGWSVEQRKHADHPDAVITKGNEACLLDLKVAPKPTRSFMEAMLAHAAIVGQTSAKSLGIRPLAVVGAASISKRMASALRAFASKHIDRGIAYGWIDGRGHLELHGSPSLESVHVAPGRRHSLPSTRRPGKSTAFSDLGQWILKVLLAPILPSSLLTAPRGRPESIRELAELADVSVHTARRVISAAKDAGFVRDFDGYLSVVDPERLFERWRMITAEATVMMPTRWILRKKSPESALRRVLTQRTTLDVAEHPTACLGLFAAADQIGIGYVRGVRPHLLLRSVSREELERFGLRQAEPGEEVDVFVGQPKYTESTFRGAVLHRNVWATDIVQTWLDTSHHPARGSEQASVIMRRVLSPMILENEPR